MVSKTEEPEKQTQETGEPGADDEDLVVEVESKTSTETTEEPEVSEETPEPRTYTEEEYQGLQRAIGKKDDEIKNLRAQGAVLEGLVPRIARLEEDQSIVKEGQSIVLDYLDTLGGSGEPLEVAAPPAETEIQKRRREWKERGKSQLTPEQEAERRQAQQFMNEAKAQEVNLNDPQARSFFEPLSGPAEALEKLPEFVANRKQAEETRKNAETEKDAELTKLRERTTNLETLLEKAGVKVVETGGPSGSGGAGGLEELNRQFKAGEITLEEFEERSKELKK